MILGPRIVPATYAIGATGGHCDNTSLPPSVTTPSPAIANGPEQIRATVRRLHKYGAEVIKFCGTGGVLSKGDTVGGQQYDLAEMKALVDEAHMLDLKVAVHAHGTAGIKDARYDLHFEQYQDNGKAVGCLGGVLDRRRACEP